MMATDLQRIELAFPVEAMLHVVDHGADPKDPAVKRLRLASLHLPSESALIVTGSGRG